MCTGGLYVIDTKMAVEEEEREERGGEMMPCDFCRRENNRIAE